MAAGSTDRRNTFIKSLCRGSEPQGLTRPFVELTCHFIQVRLRMHGQVRPFGKILPEKTIGVLIGATLPGALRIAEIDIDIGRQAKTFVIGKLFAPVPCQRFVEFSGQLPCMFDQRIYNRLGVPTWNLHQHHVARVTFDQGGDVGVLRSGH